MLDIAGDAYPAWMSIKLEKTVSVDGSDGSNPVKIPDNRAKKKLEFPVTVDRAIGKSAVQKNERRPESFYLADEQGPQLSLETDIDIRIYAFYHDIGDQRDIERSKKTADILSQLQSGEITPVDGHGGQDEMTFRFFPAKMFDNDFCGLDLTYRGGMNPDAV